MTVKGKTVRPLNVTDGDDRSECRSLSVVRTEGITTEYEDETTCVIRAGVSQELGSKTEESTPATAESSSVNVDEPTPDTIAKETKSKKGRGKPKKVAVTSSKAKIHGTPRSRKRIESPSHKITEYFPVRRSSRMPSDQKRLEKDLDLQHKLLSVCEEGLRIEMFDEKGRGVVAEKHFCRGDFVVEYKGDLVTRAVGKKRETAYFKCPEIGSYIYFFQHSNKPWCVDATEETPYLGRLVNHSRKNPNCRTRSTAIKGTPYLYLEAVRDICPGEELTYDYGDRSKEAIELHPWLANT